MCSKACGDALAFVLDLAREHPISALSAKDLDDISEHAKRLVAEHGLEEGT